MIECDQCCEPVDDCHCYGVCGSCNGTGEGPRGFGVCRECLGRGEMPIRQWLYDLVMSDRGAA